MANRMGNHMANQPEKDRVQFVNCSDAVSPLVFKTERAWVMAQKMTERDAKHRYWVAEAMSRLEYDLASEVMRHSRIPPEWHGLSSPGRSPKKKVTMMVEEDVVKFFKSLGYGYQSRMNDVLKAFVHAKLGRLLTGQDTPEGYAERVPSKRADWGEFSEFLG